VLILGINAFHGDSSACIIKDGELLAAAEEERFRRIKHWAGFPSEAISYCLAAAGANIQDLMAVAVNRRPLANLSRKLLYLLRQRPDWRLLRERLAAARELNSVPRLLEEHFAPTQPGYKARTIQVEHHLAHLASAFLVSPFERAALLSVDGFGDFLSTMGGLGEGTRIRPFLRIFFPHSLGLFYTAITQWLGFKKYGDEYKVMGLAALGKPKHLDLMRDLVRDFPGGFQLNLRYFVHHRQSLSLMWDGEEPSFGDVYSGALEQALGPGRTREEAITERHADIAASLQARYEEVFFRLLNELYDRTRLTNLCLAGGCALNSVANGKIFDQTPFREVYIQPAAHDAGGALGAAYHVYHSRMGRERKFIMTSSCWGPEFSPAEIEGAMARYQSRLAGAQIRRLDQVEELVQETASLIAAGKIVGWFQGRMEWGPRALGNRSIVVDPRNPRMKETLNSRIKRREPFRPFAPSVLLEDTGEYFEKDYPDPFMLKVYPIRVEKRELLPAVTHVDGTGRLQTVSREENPLYYLLIRAFKDITGVPVVLNTSFNENEPIVCTPDEALECFLRTRMDVLVMGPFLIERLPGE
jgi:carbamoyltransferase